MKNSLFVAATAVVGQAAAGVHRMKLQKVPLHEQLVCVHLTSTSIFQSNALFDRR